MDLQPNKTDATIKPITNTRISASEWNQLVGSCMEFITAAGFTPDAEDNEQFLNAFKAIAASLELVGANTNLSNLTPTGEAHFAKPDLSNATVPYVVSRTHSGTTYCTIWSDGYCEQGGRLEYTNGAGFTNVALPVPYADANYSLVVCLNRNDAAADFRSGYIVDAGNISVGYDHSAPCWETKGYI